jgi:hypothetical protein
METRIVFLLLNLALAFYNVGTIWAHEVDIFRTWKLLGANTFHNVQLTHWKKLPYWVFLPVGVGVIGSITLIWYHPANSPIWAIWGGVLFQALPHTLTALFWGRWQAKLAKDPLGAQSPYLEKILKTHWIRTALISAYAVILFIWTVDVIL